MTRDKSVQVDPDDLRAMASQVFGGADPVRQVKAETWKARGAELWEAAEHQPGCEPTARQCE